MKIESINLQELILYHNLWINHRENGKQLRLQEQNISNVTITNQNLSYTSYSNCTFDKVIFDTTSLSNSIFENCVFNNCNFINSDLSTSILKNIQFNNTNTYFNNLSECNLLNCNIVHSDFLFNQIDKTHFEKCIFDMSDINYNSYIDFPTGLNDCQYISDDVNYKQNILENTSLSYEQILTSQKQYALKMIEFSKSSSEKTDELIRVEKLLLDKSMIDITNELKKQKIYSTPKEQDNNTSSNSRNTKRTNTYKSSLTQAIKENINLLDYARSLGYTPMKIGNQWTLKEFKDTLRINPSPKSSNIYLFSRHSTSQAGSIIDFEMMINNCTQDQAIKNLRHLLPSSKQIEYYKSIETPETDKRIKEEKQKLELPKRTNGQYNRVIAYLNDTRKIDYQIIVDLIKSKNLYEDSKHNAVFVGYDKENNPAYACKRGTLSEKRFTGEVKNSNKEVGFFLNNNSDTYFISESVIDNLSIATFLKASGIDYKKYNYLSLGGIDTKSINYHLKGSERIKESKFYIATDNDKAGAICRHNIKSELIKLGVKSSNIFDKIPKSKDFNEDLQNSVNYLKSPKIKQSKNIVVAPKTSNKAMTKQVNFEYER